MSEPESNSKSEPKSEPTLNQPDNQPDKARQQAKQIDRELQTLQQQIDAVDNEMTPERMNEIMQDSEKHADELNQPKKGQTLIFPAEVDELMNEFANGMRERQSGCK